MTTTTAAGLAPETLPVDTAAGTRYVILAADDGQSFTVAGDIVARDRKQAIRAFLDGKTEIDATYVAVPASSWEPVKVKTAITLEFGAPSGTVAS